MMVVVHFPPHLRRHIDVPEECQSEAVTVAELVRDLDARFPGLAAYLVHENGVLRQHVNIFLEDRLVRDREALTDSLEDVEEVWVMQALSGG